ncbi:hypothetical protein POPTR_016G124300v4 [Populus trichocarpa]|uniref:Uncharacterized protein n=1 Tax=Populus trichocarpa TaxID=3694 RepID=A0A2K1XEQ0_POPTR|nr:hypothetical protein BDE02_16G110800 [Populus trichocarpa]PNS99268.1 hypothetical protein POPTR_016G124300v4 [Populus trichocarpa]
MEKRRSWLWFKQRFVFSAKSTLLKLASSSRHKNRGNNRGLMNLGKDLETCGEYTDIQVMWKMIHSCHPIAQDTRRKRPYRKFCFRLA